MTGASWTATLTVWGSAPEETVAGVMTAWVRVTDGTFLLMDRSPDNSATPIDTADWSTPLVAPMNVGAMLRTQTYMGKVRVRAEAVDGPPVEVVGGPWDDMVEVTVHAPVGELRVVQHEYQPGDDEPPRLPLLSTHGPGSYGLRVHVRGRGLVHDEIQEHSSEEYLLVVWPVALSPGPPTPAPTQERLSEQRRAELDALRGPPRSAPATASRGRFSGGGATTVMPRPEENGEPTLDRTDAHAEIRGSFLQVRPDSGPATSRDEDG